MMEKMNLGVGRTRGMDRDNSLSIGFVQGRGGNGSLTITIGKCWAKKAEIGDGDYVAIYWDSHDLTGMIKKTESRSEGVKVRQKSKIGTLTFTFCRQSHHPKPDKITRLHSVSVTPNKELMFEFPKCIIPIDEQKKTYDEFDPSKETANEWRARNYLPREEAEEHLKKYEKEPRRIHVHSAVEDEWIARNS